MLELFKVKTFWAGLATVVGGVGACLTGGGVVAGVQLIVAGLVLMITGDDIQRARKVPVANGGGNGATAGAAAEVVAKPRPR